MHSFFKTDQSSLLIWLLEKPVIAVANVAAVLSRVTSLPFDYVFFLCGVLSSFLVGEVALQALLFSGIIEVKTIVSYFVATVVTLMLFGFICMFVGFAWFDRRDTHW